MAEVFDVNALKHEADIEPFQFKVDDDIYTLVHPQDLDWQAITLAQADAAVGNVRPLLRVWLGDEFASFATHKIDVRTLRTILEKGQQHYGVNLPE